jgi:hypothetical protein
MDLFCSECSRIHCKKKSNKVITVYDTFARVKHRTRFMYTRNKSSNKNGCGYKVQIKNLKGNEVFYTYIKLFKTQFKTVKTKVNKTAFFTVIIVKTCIIVQKRRVGVITVYTI